MQLTVPRHSSQTRSTMSYSLRSLMGMRCAVSNHPPDGFVHLALQLAYYCLHGRSTSVYEPALTRPFYHDHFDTIRSLTYQSFAFVRLCRPWKCRSWRRRAPGVANMKEWDGQHDVSQASASSLYALFTSALRVHAR
ncbi:Choline/Carnitine o-acyltransferase-domain-containing protein [Scleroderma yunnanense]